MVVILYQALFFIFGMLVGSFLNVVIYRMPRNESVITPRSKCPSCSTEIKWFQNIPLLSYLVLWGKCSQCNFAIPLRYPLTEFLVGIFALLLMPNIFSPMELFSFGFYFSVACVFLAHFFIDLEHQILPDKLNLYLLFISLPYVFINFPPTYWIIGGAVGFLGPYVVTLIFYKLRGVIGLGGGDIKLFGILGLILGPLGVLNNIFMSCMLGSLIGGALILTKKIDKNTPFAFGPFIILAATIQIFFPVLLDYINPLYIK